jgi:hypothetical protein
MSEFKRRPNTPLWPEIDPLRESPGFAVVAILTLALGVGANTAIFSVIKSVLLSPLPYATPDRLMAVSQGDARTKTPGTTSYGTLVEWRARKRLFDSLVAYRDWGLPMTGAGDAELVRGLRVSAGFFDMLGVPMQLGRNFTEEEDRPNTRRVLILEWLRIDQRSSAKRVHHSAAYAVNKILVMFGTRPLRPTRNSIPSIAGILRSAIS